MPVYCNTNEIARNWRSRSIKNRKGPYQNPRKAKKYAAAVKEQTAKQEKEVSTKLAHLRSLFMFVEAGLTQAQYEVVRDTNPGF